MLGQKSTQQPFLGKEIYMEMRAKEGEDRVQ